MNRNLCGCVSIALLSSADRTDANGNKFNSSAVIQWTFAIHDGVPTNRVRFSLSYNVVGLLKNVCLALLRVCAWLFVCVVCVSVILRVFSLFEVRPAFMTLAR